MVLVENLSEATFSKGGSPRVLDDNVLISVGRAVANANDLVIKLDLACLGVDSTVGIVEDARACESQVVAAHGDDDRSLSDGGLESDSVL